MSDKIRLTRKEYNELLKSEEYEYCMVFDDKGVMYLDWFAMEKTYYKPVCGDYVLGLKITNMINNIPNPKPKCIPVQISA